jgi:superoxide dismutase, Fe-Mn family
MFKPITLPYNYNELEPYIDAITVETHYSKHHSGYADKLNGFLTNHQDFLNMPLEDLLKNLDKLPENLKLPVLNNAGQVYNHDLYWQSMSPNGGGNPTGKLGDKINETFGNFEQFIKEFSEAGVTQFGSGWVFLSMDKNNNIVIDKTSNADSPLLHNKTPLMTMDVWEHAYYLKYKNLRPSYIEAFWNLVNWKDINSKFESLT